MRQRSRGAHSACVGECGGCIKCCTSAHPKIRQDSKLDINARNPGCKTETGDAKTGEDFDRAKDTRCRHIRLCFDIYVAGQAQAAPSPGFVEGIGICCAK